MNSIKPFIWSLGPRAIDFPKNAISQISWRGRNIYTTCSSSLASSRDACCKAARKTFQNATWIGVKLGYSLGSPRLMKSMYFLHWRKTVVTPLHAAAFFGTRRDVEALLSKSADLNIRDIAEKTPLHYAARNQNLEGMRCLLNAGANPFVDSDDIWGPLALAENQIETTRVLLGIEDHPAFRSCKNLHDCCEILWPASREKLPPEWEKWAKQTGADKIVILRSLPGATKLFFLVFEVINALQRERLKELRVSK